MGKQELLSKITTNYLSSHDFNGLSACEMSQSEINMLIQLIDEDNAFILIDSDDINIFINRKNSLSSKEIQKNAIVQHMNFVAYPTPRYLLTLNIPEDKPFTKMLVQGAEQFRVLYFTTDVLELYASNPQYEIWDGGYRGTICIREEFAYDDVNHSEYIKDFGIAYPKNKPLYSDRAIGVFLHDLSRLNYEAQCKWRAFLLHDQSSFIVNNGFIKNLIYGDWVDNYWIFDALLDEIELINTMSKNMKIPFLFSNEYKRENRELIGYRIILIPTLKNYYDFISAIEKIVINNINYKTFQMNAFGIKGIERKNDDGSLKGSIVMLDEWIKLNYASDPIVYDAFKRDVIDVLRSIRKIRQIPAHELYDNKHDKTVYQQQNQVIEKVYQAVKIIRIIFGKHPSNRTLSIPKQLQDTNHIVIY